MNTPTLHEAFDAYLRFVEAHSQVPLSGSVRQRMYRTKVLRNRSSDISLADLDLHGCTGLIEHWRLRPLSKAGIQFSRLSAKALVAELVRFLKWLDETDEFEWRIPKGFRRINRRVGKTPHEQRYVPPPSYSVSELALLNRHATEADRLLLYLSLNCGMGFAGLLRLRISDFLFDHQHEFAERIGLDSKERHAFMRVTLPKTGQMFEWILWPETAVVVRRAVEHSRSLNVESIFISSDGTSLYRHDHSGPGAVLGRQFRRHVERVRKDRPEFPSLPQGSLRRGMADLIRCMANGEIAGLYLGHCAHDIDSLRRRPFGKLHWSLMEMRRELEPVFSNGGSNNG